MKGYRHLTMHDRNKIWRMNKDGAKQCEIAAALHISPSTVSRELRRGSYTYTNGEYIEVTDYIPERSHKRYRDHLAAKGAEIKIGKDHALAEWLECKIADEKYSPSAALAAIDDLPEEERGKFTTTLCRQTLYSYIDKGLFLRITNKDLPFEGSRRKKKTQHVTAVKVPRGESIEKRPPEVDEREIIGHWEGDTVVSCRGGRACLLVLTERVLRKEIIRKIPDKTAASVVKALDKLEREYGRRFSKIFKTITFDNGGEFADTEGIERSVYKNGGQRTKAYYCHPYSSYERGSNEKQNQMIRRWLPKGTNFDHVTMKQIAKVEEWLNKYPRRVLKWQNSHRLFEHYLQNQPAL